MRVHERGISNMVIEEFMLVCNQTVARHMRINRLPAVYRVHEKPEKSKVESFVSIIKGYGYNFKADNLDKPGDFALLLSRLEGRPEERVISRLMLEPCRRPNTVRKIRGILVWRRRIICIYLSNKKIS